VIVLVGCSATKLEVPAPAKDLYQGPIFKMVRKIIEHPSAKRPTAWGILSAKHGLLAPDDVIDPYDLSVDTFNYRDRQNWCDDVVRDIESAWGTRETYRVYAGASYIGSACLQALHVDACCCLMLRWEFGWDLFGGSTSCQTFPATGVSSGGAGRWWRSVR